jgi:hypothetical protein
MGGCFELHGQQVWSCKQVAHLDSPHQREPREVMALTMAEFRHSFRRCAQLVRRRMPLWRAGSRQKAHGEAGRIDDAKATRLKVWEELHKAAVVEAVVTVGEARFEGPIFDSGEHVTEDVEREASDADVAYEPLPLELL